MLIHYRFRICNFDSNHGCLLGIEAGGQKQPSLYAKP